MRSSTSTSHQLHSSHNQLHTVLSRWKSSNRLQTRIFPRRRLCADCTGLQETKQLYPTAALKLKLDLLMQDYGWMGCILAMTLWETIIDSLHLQAGDDSKPVHQSQIPENHEPFWRHWLKTSKTAIIQHANVIFHIRRQHNCHKTKNKGRSPECVLYHAHIVFIWIGFVTT